MQQIFKTRQFMAGNSPAVRIPMSMAFPNKTELVVIREGSRIIVEAQAESLESLPGLFAKIGKNHNHKRPEFIEVERTW
ncbi:MAG: hypothetical protein LBP94_03900 [Zoogloeaceae bacterium]|jgi:antitoxin VapB|nr:hypothetical protein [Zoogloeaceae bacterium]